MATRTLSQLTLANLLDVDDTTVFVIDDNDGNTRKLTLAQLRTSLLLAVSLTGPVTGTVPIGTASSLATTITDGVVTLAKMANLATQRLIGRSTAGTGVPESIAIGAGLTLSAGTLSASEQAAVAPSATLLTYRAFGGF